MVDPTRYTDTVFRNDLGHPFPNVKVYVYNQSDLTLATLTDDNGEALVNPVLTGAGGAYVFNAASPVAITVNGSILTPGNILFPLCGGGGGTVTLQTLTPSTGFQIGTAVTGTLAGKATGSIIASNIPGVIVTGSSYSGTPTGSAATIANAFVETLGSAIGSPKSTAATVIAAGATAPGAPVISATPGNAQNTISLVTASAPNGATVTGYTIYRGLTSGGESATPIATNVTLPFTDASLTNGTAYFYTAAGVNSVGTGAQSAEVNATPSAGGGSNAATYNSQPTTYNGNAVTYG